MKMFVIMGPSSYYKIMEPSNCTYLLRSAIVHDAMRRSSRWKRDTSSRGKVFITMFCEIVDIIEIMMSVSN